VKQKINFFTKVVLLAISLLSFNSALASEADEVLRYVNDYRATHHLPPLKMNQRMSQEAIKHSRDMSTHRIGFGHIGFEGRMKRLSQAIPHYNGGSENVAAGKWNARQVVDGWMSSPGHRRNILGHYQLTGIGITRDGSGRVYYTQLFMRNNGAQVAQISPRRHVRHPFVFKWH